MADSTADARRRVEDARAALDADIATLNDRLPAAATLARTGLAGGGGLAGLGLAAKVISSKLSQRSQEKVLSREASIQARAIATALAAQAEATRQAELRAAAPPKPKRGAEPRPAAPAADAADAIDRIGEDGDDGGGPPWGLLLLVAAIVAAVVAIVTRDDDEDLWIRPEA